MPSRRDTGQGISEFIGLLLFNAQLYISCRFVLAGSDKLHKKVLEMSSRIRQLEDALQIAHAAISGRDHPLLAPELLKVKNGVDMPGEEDGKEDDREEQEELDNEVMSSFDTLAISDRGEARFFGRTGSEVCHNS